MRSDDLTFESFFCGDMRTSAKHHAIDQRVLGHHFLFSCFMPLFGDTCRDEGLFAAHVP